MLKVLLKIFKIFSNFFFNMSKKYKKPTLIFLQNNYKYLILSLIIIFFIILYKKFYCNFFLKTLHDLKLKNDYLLIKKFNFLDLNNIIDFSIFIKFKKTTVLADMYINLGFLNSILFYIFYKIYFLKQRILLFLIINTIVLPTEIFDSLGYKLNKNSVFDSIFFKKYMYIIDLFNNSFTFYFYMLIDDYSNKIQTFNKNIWLSYYGSKKAIWVEWDFFKKDLDKTLRIAFSKSFWLKIWDSTKTDLSQSFRYGYECIHFAIIYMDSHSYKELYDNIFYVFKTIVDIVLFFFIRVIDNYYIVFNYFQQIFYKKFIFNKEIFNIFFFSNKNIGINDIIFDKIFIFNKIFKKVLMFFLISKKNYFIFFTPNNNDFLTLIVLFMDDKFLLFNELKNKLNFEFFIILNLLSDEIFYYHYETIYLFSFCNKFAVYCDNLDRFIFTLNYLLIDYFFSNFKGFLINLKLDSTVTPNYFYNYIYSNDTFIIVCLYLNILNYLITTEDITKAIIYLDDITGNIYFFLSILGIKYMVNVLDFYKNIFLFLINFIIFEILNIVIILLFVLVGGILPLWERKYLSLVQRRIGPKFVGYKGRLQFIADALKVLFKDYLYLYNTNKYFYFMLPIFFLNLNLLFFINIVFYSNCSYMQIEYNFLFLLFFSMYSNIILFLVGYVSKNKYTLLSSNRILNLFFINEIFLSSLFLFLFLLFNSFSFYRLFFFKNNITIFLLFLPLIPLIFYLFLIDVNKVPFDLVEAESELIMGYHVEYSGFLFGLFVLVEYLHLFFFVYILYLLFGFF